jgi:hypothetical protein
VNTLIRMLLDLGSTMNELDSELRAVRSDDPHGPQREETRDPKAEKDGNLAGRRPDPQDPSSPRGSTGHAGPRALETKEKPGSD